MAEGIRIVPTAGDAPEIPDRRRKVAHRLARIEGQVRGIRQLVESGADCEKIAMQMTAARRALDRAFYEMLACSLEAHVQSAGTMPEARASIGELSRLLARFG